MRDMETSECSQQGQKRVRGKNNSVSSRRIWQKKEKNVLMAAMMELIGQQWRNENGQFKPGFYAKLEESLKKTFPETDLCANLHIESKKDANAKGMRNKPFPYYDNWCVLFGKDRATGDLAEGPEKAVAAMNEEEIQTNNNPLLVDIDFSVNATTPMQSGSSSGRKRSRNETISAGLATMTEQFGSMLESTKLTMAGIAQRIGYDHDLSESRKRVNAELKKLPLESSFRLRAASMIVCDAHKVDLFFSLTEEEDRIEWVYMLLAGEV